MDWLKDDGIFLPMINDTGRNIFYKNAIESCVKDKIVVDIGTGTGFLSILAARAGAKKVYSVEQNLERFNFAKEIFAKLNLTDTIEIIHANYLDTNLQADYFVSETMGNWIFDENILAIADHTKNRGLFIPGSFEITAVVYNEHPIFSVVQTDSEAYEFQPDIAIDSEFENIINNEFQRNYPVETQRHKSNMICNFFQQYKKMTDLKLHTFYQSEPLIVDLSNPPAEIKIVIPKGKLSARAGRICIFWKAKFNEFVMDVTDTIWCVPSKFIHNLNQDITIRYDFDLKCWMFEFHEYN
jgi:predicted RNA methylase